MGESFLLLLQGMQIHISQTTKDHLEHEPYIIEERGKIFVKVTPYLFK